MERAAQEVRCPLLSLSRLPLFIQFFSSVTLVAL
jgi:hypothetical protein